MRLRLLLLLLFFGIIVVVVGVVGFVGFVGGVVGVVVHVLMMLVVGNMLAMSGVTAFLNMGCCFGTGDSLFCTQRSSLACADMRRTLVTFFAIADDGETMAPRQDANVEHEPRRAKEVVFPIKEKRNMTYKVKTRLKFAVQSVVANKLIN